MSANKSEVATTPAQERSLSTQLAERSITPAQWHTLARSLYPGARQDSVLMVIDYCTARGLDPLKKPCHIVPMEIKVDGNNYEWRDVVMPGIYELRTTAIRTGLYMGHSKPEYGPPLEYMGVTAPEWCEVTIYRWNEVSSLRIEFPVRVLFRECCGTKFDKKSGEHRANARWSKAPVQMLTKCTEAAGLREAFPDELGGQMTVEEMEDQRQTIDVTPEGPVAWQDKPSKLSPQKIRKVAEAMLAAEKEQDGPGLLEVWRELQTEQQEQMWGEFRSYERTALRKLLDSALAADCGIQLDKLSESNLRGCKDLDALTEAMAKVTDAYAENKQEVPGDIQSLYQSLRAEMRK